MATLVAIAVAGLLSGAFAAWFQDGLNPNVAWAAATVVVLVPFAVNAGMALIHGRLGVDLIAVIAIIGALLVGQFLAAAIVALMLAGGNALEAHAARRARSDLTALLEHAPRIAHRRTESTWEEVPASELAVDDVVLIRAGEIVPADGVVADGEAVLDESTLTGESLPVARFLGDEVRSGVSNAGDAFELRVIRPAAQSAYASLSRLVLEAEADRAPFVRIADRYATVFLPVTVLMAAIGLALTDDAVTAVALLVVATPCPLIIAAPVAIVSGLSRAARSGIVIKGGAALEQLGAARTVLLDKTGTITLGEPGIAEVIALNGLEPDEILRRAASVDQFSAHQLAESLVAEAERRGLELERPRHVAEEPGRGIEGTLSSGLVSVGSAHRLESQGFDTAAAAAEIASLDGSDGRARILVGTEDGVTGAIVMADLVRDDAKATIDRLRADGIEQIAMLTGDRLSVAETIGSEVGVDRVYADMTPNEKLEIVHGTALNQRLHPVVMVGDGVNDAPALAAADVGIAMGVRGSTISAESADAVIVTDRIGRVGDAISIGRQTMRIARQSVILGISLSLVAMAFAAAGLLPPVAGAVLQEAIDLAAILNALRVLSIPVAQIESAPAVRTARVDSGLHTAGIS